MTHGRFVSETLCVCVCGCSKRPDGERWRAEGEAGRRSRRRNLYQLGIYFRRGRDERRVVVVVVVVVDGGGSVRGKTCETQLLIRSENVIFRLAAQIDIKMSGRSSCHGVNHS